MKWLITVSRSVDVPTLAALLTRHGGTLDAKARRIPLGPDEYAAAADGPDDLPERIRQEPGVLAVHPNSEQTPY